MLRVIRQKLKASSMMESVVALVVISTIFVLSLGIFLNVADFSFSTSEVNASLILNDISIETKKAKSFYNEEISRESLVI
ncbi:MAG TPA: hypothetical protein VNW99_07420, partial [Cytophagaceae bacterium]|nr:hypothetical protein [Cytophagaceae bacterium]